MSLANIVGRNYIERGVMRLSEVYYWLRDDVNEYRLLFERMLLSEILV